MIILATQSYIHFQSPKVYVYNAVFFFPQWCLSSQWSSRWLWNCQKSLTEILLYAGPHPPNEDCKLLIANFTWHKNDLFVVPPSSCFISDVGVFFGAFLGPIFAILIFNTVIFILVVGVAIKHNRSTLSHSKQQANKKTTIRLLFGITGVMFLFGLTWLIGALTITGFSDTRVSTTFQVLFVTRGKKFSPKD